MRCRRIVNGDVVWFGAIPEQIPPQKSLEKTTWDELEAICHRGLHTSYFKVGDKKTVNINGQDYTFVIADFDRYDIIGKDKKACITFMMENVYQDDLQMNTKSQIKEIDLTQAYNTRVTANGLSVVDEAPTTVHKIAGETKATENLFDLTPTDSEITEAAKRGITVTNQNNTFTFSGGLTADYSTIKYFELPRHLYGKTITFSQSKYFKLYTDVGSIVWKIGKTVDGVYSQLGTTFTNALTVTFDDQNAIYKLYIQTGNWKGQSIDGEETISFMVNEGSTALPYSEYYAGLKSASFKGITSTGRNLLDESLFLPWAFSTTKVSEKQIAFTISAGTYTVSNIVESVETLKNVLGIYLVDDSNKVILSCNAAGNSGTNVSSTFTVTEEVAKNTKYLRIHLNPVDAEYNIEHFMMNRGDTALPYEDYIADTSFQLSAARQLRKWDYIDVDNQLLVIGSDEITQETAFTDGQLAQYGDYIISADRKTIVYKTATTTQTTLTLQKTYKAWRDGTETIVIDASQKQNLKGLEVTIDQTYSVVSFGWQPSDIRETTLPMLFETLDQHLQHAIETVGIESYAGDELVKTYDKLFIPATFEIENLRGTDKQFAYYRSIKPGSEAVNRIRYLNNVAQAWWTRDSSQIETQTSYLANGNRSSISTSQTAKIPICFCVGERQSVYTQFFNENDKHDNYADKQQAVVDSLTQRLSVIKSELWYNVYYGLPLLDKLQTKFPLDAFVTKTIQEHPDVVSIKSFTSKVVDHQYTCSMTIQSKYGEIQLNI